MIFFFIRKCKIASASRFLSEDTRLKIFKSDFDGIKEKISLLD